MSGIRIDRWDGNAVEFGVTTFPNRKARVLYRMRGAMCEPLAYFRSDEDADAFQRILDFMLDTLKPVPTRSQPTTE